MANQEHLHLLKQGVEVWNQWRKKYPEIRPDLREINVRHADLRRVNFHHANLHGATVNHTDLSGAMIDYADLSSVDLHSASLIGASPSRATFRDATLRDANLSGADMTYATLRDVNLSGANLSDTNLGGADLSGATFSNSTLSNTDLSYAHLSHTIFAAVDLRRVKGLETVIHHGPSTLGLDTIRYSQGEISDLFLRGAGLSDRQIDYVHSQVNIFLEYVTCFLSYSNRDRTFAERLYAHLQSKGVRCWFAPEDLKIGDHYHQRIDESIRLYDKLILILSEHAVQSAWVEREVVSAREKEDQLGHEVLFPICLDDTVMQTTKAWAADVRRRWHIGDFTQWKDHDAYLVAFERLLRDLKAKQKPED